MAIPPNPDSAFDNVRKAFPDPDRDIKTYVFQEWELDDSYALILKILKLFDLKMHSHNDVFIVSNKELSKEEILTIAKKKLKDEEK